LKHNRATNAVITKMRKTSYERRKRRCDGKQHQKVWPLKKNIIKSIKCLSC
jgi:hypothetical protein